MPNHRQLPGRLLLVAATMATLGALAALVAEDLRDFLLLLLFLTPLVVVTVTDLEARVIPNRMIYPALFLAIGLSWAWPDRGLIDCLVGLAVGFGFMFFPFLLSGGRGIAAGDVKLAGFIGGAAGFPNVLPGLMLGIVAGGLAAVVVGLAARSHRASFAYGPYLALGGMIALLAGEDIVDWYTD